MTTNKYISHVHVPLSLLNQEQEGRTVCVIRVLLVLESVSVLQDLPPQILGAHCQGGPGRINETVDSSLFSCGLRLLFFLSPFLVFDEGRNFAKLILPSHGCLCLLAL